MRFRRVQQAKNHHHYYTLQDAVTSKSRNDDDYNDNDDTDDMILPLTTTTARDLGSRSDNRIISGSSSWLLCASISRLFCCCSFSIFHHRRHTKLITLLLTMTILLVLLYQLFQKLIPNKHSTFNDVFWRAIWLMPISYIEIHVLERHLWSSLQPDYEYHLHNNNTFVINLDVDTKRWNQYHQKNKIGTRFSAVDFSTWIIKNRNNNATTTSTATTRIKDGNNDDNDNDDLQLLMQQYPNLANLVHVGRLGEAGVMASHLKVYTQILQRNLSYAFIFEDDVLFHVSSLSSETETNKNRKDYDDDNSIVIRAPYPADVIFLTSRVLRATHIQVPATAGGAGADHNNHSSVMVDIIRVMGGSGTYGILVTNQGATKLLSLLQHGSCGYFDLFHDCRVDPLDIAIMKLAARHGLQMYMPFPVPHPVQFYHSHLGQSSSAKSLRDFQT